MTQQVSLPLPASPAAPPFLKWLVLFVLAGALLYGGGIVWIGWTPFADAIDAIGPTALLLAAVVASSAYLLRFARWHFALHQLGSHVPLRFDLGVYLAGLALTASPGKLGETFRSALLLPRGVPVSRSLACFLADRLSDVLGVCLIGAMAGAWQGRLWNVATIAFVVITCGSFVFRLLVERSATQRVGRWLPASLRKPGRVAAETLTEWARVWRAGHVVLFTLAAVLAYGLQAGVFAWLSHRMGLALPVAAAFEIFVQATLIGAASLVPGGLGAMESVLVFQLDAHGAETGVAVAIAIATRLVTLWVGVLIGLLALLTVVAGARREVGLRRRQLLPAEE